MSRVINTSSHIILTNSHLKLNDHIDIKNKEGWELMSVFVQAVGIEEFLFMFWRKVVDGE